MAVPSSVIRVASQEGTWPRWSDSSAYPERFIACNHTLPREKAHGARAWLMRTGSVFEVVTRACHGATDGRKIHTPSNLVVAHWTSDVESTAPLGVLLRHNLWIPSWCLISCKIRSIISVTCDFATKSDGICTFPLFASWPWPLHTGYSLKPIDMTVH